MSNRWRHRATTVVITISPDEELEELPSPDENASESQEINDICATIGSAGLSCVGFYFDENGAFDFSSYFWKIQTRIFYCFFSSIQHDRMVLDFVQLIFFLISALLLAFYIIHILMSQTTIPFSYFIQTEHF